MTDQQLGRLEAVDLRQAWITEAGDFTPWLARPENISLLGDALNMDLEIEAQEKDVGPFRADILCKDITTGHWVLIENQLERTDHNHLGQLLTYAAGLDAVTIVWIAARFTEEHRATLDWLNEITDERFQFFGLEVELWRIGNSPVAPKFNVVSKPNSWSQSVKQGAQAIEDDIQRDYWDALNDALEAVHGPIAGNRKAQPQSWMAYKLGRTGFSLGAAMNRPKQHVRAEIWIASAHAKDFFAQLKAQKDAIEKELGYPLEWEELPDRQARRIAIYLNDVDPEDKSDWPRQHEWLAKHLNDLHRVFAPRVAALHAEADA
jgi:hypothetical protein